MNVPNTLTLLRIFLVPAFLIAVIHDAPAVAFTIFLFAGCTDLLDGFLARLLEQKTLLGQYLDPTADKLLMTVSYIALASKGMLPPWLAVLVVSKDVLVALGLGILYFAGHHLHPVPNRCGKLATFLQAVTAGLVLLAGAGGLDLVSTWLFLLTGVMTAVAGLLYILRGFRDYPAGDQTGR